MNLARHIAIISVSGRSVNGKNTMPPCHFIRFMIGLLYQLRAVAYIMGRIPFPTASGDMSMP
jgi:hypothetical protein